MLQWVWFLGFSWRGKVGSKNGLLGKQKLEAVQRQRWKRGQDAVYMTLCNSLCQLVVFTACHFLYPQSPAVQRWAQTLSRGGGESSWHSLKSSSHVPQFVYCLFLYQLRRNFFGFTKPMQANEAIAGNIIYVYIMIPNACHHVGRKAAVGCWHRRRELSQHKCKNTEQEMLLRADIRCCNCSKNF